MKNGQSKSRFYEFLNRPRLGFCRGVLPYNFLLFLLFIAFAQQCFSRAEEVVGLLSLVSPLFVFAHEIVFRRTRLPEPVAHAYDALFEDVSAELNCQSFKDQAAAFFGQVGHLGRIVLDWILESIWFVVALFVFLFHGLHRVIVARTQSAYDWVSFRKFLLLTQVHSIRAPSLVLN